MKPAVFVDIDPRNLRLPSLMAAASPYKLQRQIIQFGASMVAMPPPWVYESTDGELVVYNGVTRATRIAKLSPGTLIRVQVIDKLKHSGATLPKLGDHIP